MTDEKLMHRFKKTTALLRRSAASVHTANTPIRGRGYGHILQKLSESNGISQQQLADALDLRPQTVSEALIAMEQVGLIRRVPSERDARSVLVYITPSGQQRNKELTAERNELAHQFFAPLTAEEKETLFLILCKLSTPIQKDTLS